MSHPAFAMRCRTHPPTHLARAGQLHQQLLQPGVPPSQFLNPHLHLLLQRRLRLLIGRTAGQEGAEGPDGGGWGARVKWTSASRKQL